MAALIHVCGAEYQFGQVFCGKCHHPIQQTTMPLAVSDEAGVKTADAPGGGQVEGSVECTDCGKCTRSDRAACDFCGAAREAGGDTSAAPSTAGGAALALPGGRSIPIALGETVLLGRHAKDQRVSDALGSYDAVSRSHAEVTLLDGALRVRDLDSTNGTFVNGERVRGERTMRFTEPVQLGFGRELTFVVQLGGAHE